jgi:endonuclease/exonuclease/phosphatase family metal-dependent hydrolase
MKRVTKVLVRALVGACVVALGGYLALGHDRGAHADPKARSTHHHRKPHAPRERRPAPSVAPDSPWASADACRAALSRGGSSRRSGTARIGAWNLHWFPDGRPGDRPALEGADIAWLACGIAWMKLDVLAVEEIKRPPRGDAGLDALKRELDALTGGAWRSTLDDCPAASGQHVGLLHDSKRVTLVSSTTVGALNPRGAPCKDELRPGIAGYFRFPGGLDLTVIGVHLKSGVEARAVEERARSFTAFAEAVASARRSASDADVLLLGDMNSMGCDECSPAISPGAELTRTDALLAGLGVPVTRVPAEPACSHHYKNRSTLLDWAVRSDLAELPPKASVVVSGACGELGCDALSSALPSQTRLSDHCPIWVELDDSDRDG